MSYNKGKNIRVSNQCHTTLIEQLPKKIVMGAWVEEAILEKLARERKTEKIRYDSRGNKL